MRSALFTGPRKAREAEHSVIYRNENEFSGWPFTHGFWETAEGHFVLSFKRDKANYRNASEINHDHLSEKSVYQHVVVRSEDRGRSWKTDNAVVLWDSTMSEETILAGGAQNYAAEGPIDYRDRNVLVASSTTPTYGLPTSKSWVRVSKDGGRSWLRPILLPLVGLPSLSGQASPMVRSDGRSLLFLVVVSSDGWTRRPVVYASLDGGTAWTFLSFITPKNDDGATDGDWKTSFRFGGHRWFYPRGLQLPDGRILCSIRCQRDPTGIMWTEMFESEDGGRTWRFLSRVNDWGAPGDIARMSDGRIACVYGYRLAPYGIRARISEDEGKSWGPEIILRDDGGSWDLGYPRVVERAPGELLAMYYFNRKDDPIQQNGGVRHIAQTVFRPD